MLCNVSILSYSKSVNNLETLVSPSNTWSNKSFSLFSTSSFKPSILFSFSLADNFNSLSFLKSCDFSQMYILVLKSLKLHLTFLRYRLFHHPTYWILFLFHFLFNFLFHYFLILSMVSVFLSDSIWSSIKVFLNPWFLCSSVRILKRIFWGSKFYVYPCSEMHFLREQLF